MREILFRGKRIDNGEWVCSGNIFHLNENGGEYYIPNINTKCTTTHECNSIGEYGNISAIVCKNDTRLYKVNPETVGQYTGLTDKNGRKIFEGDIVKVTGLYPDRDGEKRIWRQFRVGEVFYYHGAFYFGEWQLCTTSEKCIEIIGNIHDNPELLEVTK